MNKVCTLHGLCFMSIYWKQKMMDKTVSKNKRYHLLKTQFVSIITNSNFSLKERVSIKKVFRLTLDAWKRILHSLCSALS